VIVHDAERSARTLDIGEIRDTTRRLAARVDDRFDGHGISRLAHELVALSSETAQRVSRLREPRRLLRAAIGVALVAVAAVLVVSASRARLGFEVDGTDEWLEVFQNGIQDLVFVGIGVAFAIGIERRLKRREALRGLHELRSFAHVIDMHQLTKDPDSVLSPAMRADHSPARPYTRYELNRYLDYCSEMLSLTSKLAASYAQESQDPIVLGAVSGIQDLTGALSNKIWQKLTILDSFDDVRS
jgi:hypothetical protein